MNTPNYTTKTDETIVHRFERMAALFPESAAVCDINTTSSTRTSYRRLNECANRAAQAISACSGNENAPVALLLQKDANAFAAIMGVLKTAKIAVPLDVSYPLQRLRFVLDDTQTPLLLTDNANQELARELAQNNCEILNLDELNNDNINEKNSDFEVAPDAAATLIYTSGSTGAPKGVLQTHRNVVHHVEGYTAQLGYCEGDRIALLGSHCVGQGIKTVFAALLNGATLCPFDVKNRSADELALWLIEQKITVLICVPSVFRYLARESSTRYAFPDLRIVRLGGDSLNARDVELFQSRFAVNCRLINSFSSTESGNATLFFIDRETTFFDDSIPVGFAHGDTKISILDEQGRELRANRTGEIAVRSRFLSPGYWRRDDLTSQKFSVCENDERLYHTGDLGFLDENGCLHHRGRTDFQIKIRGFRIEPGEIESALKTHVSIEEAVVVARDDEHGEKQLVAYFIAQNAQDIDAKTLRGFLQTKLPSHMIPPFFVSLSAFPMTPNGKIDRAQLPPFDVHRVLDVAEKTTEMSPNVIENQLAEIWKSVLKVAQIRRDDDFFACGGHSLLAGVLLARIEKQFGRKLPFSALFTHATIASQAQLLSMENDVAAEDSSVVALQPRGSRPLLFAFHDMSDGFLHYHDFLHWLGSDQPLYGVQPARENRHEPRRTLEEMAARYARDLCAFQPQGALYLCGFSFAGSVAFETARQLKFLGRRVAFVALLDTSCRADPEHSRTKTPRRQRQRNHRYIWRHLRPRERRIYFAHYAQKRLESLGNHTVKRWERLTRKNKANREHDETARQIAERTGVNFHASAAYEAQFFDGDLTLIRAMLSYRSERSLDLGWKKFARRIHIVEVSGNHSTMLQPPHVHLLVRRFTHCLRKAQQNEAQHEANNEAKNRPL